MELERSRALAGVELERSRALALAGVEREKSREADNTSHNMVYFQDGEIVQVGARERPCPNKTYYKTSLC